MRCVYTPFASLTHHGHVSIGAEPKASPDKSSVFLLRRWAAFICRDPYYTENMRDWLGPDSPRPVRMFGARNLPEKGMGRDFVLVSHELSLSGAPLIVCHLAKWCKARGIFVVVMSPSDGPLREKFTDADIPLIIDPLLATGYETVTRFSRGAPVKSHSSFLKLAREFDCLVVSSICCMRRCAACPPVQLTANRRSSASPHSHTLPQETTKQLRVSPPGTLPRPRWSLGRRQ